MTKELARYLFEAQKASDHGKYINSLPQTGHDKNGKELYLRKDTFVRKAIYYICKHRNCGAEFYVCESGNYDESLIVYFNLFKKDSSYEQISFHSFDRSLEKFISDSDVHKIKWTGRTGDSREAAYHLYCSFLT